MTEPHVPNTENGLQPEDALAPTPTPTPESTPAPAREIDPRAVVSLVIVGRANTGKSTLVATLTEDRSIRISDVPGTTTEAHRLVVHANGVPVLAVIDTPGFEDAVGALKELQKLSKSVADRAEAVRAFVEKAEREDTFVSERRLLKPILEGGAILYVADAAYPWRKNFEAELEILRWTGQPRVGLINRSAEGNFEVEWRNALDQYFSIVRTMSARDSTWDERLHLLSDIASLREAWRAPIMTVVNQLNVQWHRRRQDTARAIATMIYDSLTHTRRERVVRPDDLTADQHRLEQAFADDLRTLEETSRQAVEGIYGYSSLHRRGGVEMDAPRLEEDLFSRETWNALGLKPSQLMLAGTTGGALSGLAIDAAAGGTTLGIGALVGGAIGLAGAMYVGRDQIAKATIEGAGFGVPEAFRKRADASKSVVVGPHKGPNFPWVLMVRALGHWYAVERRTHAQAGALEVRLPLLPAADFPAEMRSALTKLFRAPSSRLAPTRGVTIGDLEAMLLRVYLDPEVQRRLRQASTTDPTAALQELSSR